MACILASTLIWCSVCMCIRLQKEEEINGLDSSTNDMYFGKYVDMVLLVRVYKIK